LVRDTPTDATTRYFNNEGKNVDFERFPMLWDADSVQEHKDKVLHPVFGPVAKRQDCPETSFVGNLRERVRRAWMVFSGDADVLVWRDEVSLDAKHNLFDTDEKRFERALEKFEELLVMMREADASKTAVPPSAVEVGGEPTSETAASRVSKITDTAPGSAQVHAPGADHPEQESLDDQFREAISDYRKDAIEWGMGYHTQDQHDRMMASQRRIFELYRRAKQGGTPHS
jgi:hypothetical protein